MCMGFNSLLKLLSCCNSILTCMEISCVQHHASTARRHFACRMHVLLATTGHNQPIMRNNTTTATSWWRHTWCPLFAAIHAREGHGRRGIRGAFLGHCVSDVYGAVIRTRLGLSNLFCQKKSDAEPYYYCRHISRTNQTSPPSVAGMIASPCRDILINKK
jgi:hypothetical protein